MNFWANPINLKGGRSEIQKSENQQNRDKGQNSEGIPRWQPSSGSQEQPVYTEENMRAPIKTIKNKNTCGELSDMFWKYQEDLFGDKLETETEKTKQAKKEGVIDSRKNTE